MDEQHRIILEQEKELKERDSEDLMWYNNKYLIFSIGLIFGVVI